ncbi:unnamed protein product, partial [Polarella glacialis]
ENLLPDAKEGEDEFVMLLPWALRERYSTLLASTEALCAAAELRAAQLEKEARAFPWCFQSFERSWRAVAGPIPLAAAILALLLTLLLASPLGGALQLLTVEVAPQNLPPMGPAALAQPGRCHLCVAALVAAEVNALAQVGALSQELVGFETSMGDFDEKLLTWRGIGPDPLWDWVSWRSALTRCVDTSRKIRSRLVLSVHDVMAADSERGSRLVASLAVRRRERLLRARQGKSVIS